MGIYNYNEDGYDKAGYNQRGYDKNGYDRYGYDRYGYDKNGYNKEGFDGRGFDREGINKETGTKYDIIGYDRNGYNQRGYDRYGYDKNGYNEEGFDGRGFDREGINKETGTKYNKKGYDRNGYNQKGYDEEGYDKSGYNEEGFDSRGYDKSGYNEEGFDSRGYDREGINKETGTKYNKKGYDRSGYDKDGYNTRGYDRNGYNKKGYDRSGYDKNGYDEEGFNREGINKETGTKYNKKGYDRSGYDEESFDREGYDRDGYDREGINKETGTKYNIKGYDKNGYDKDGFDEEGYNKEGFDRTQYNKYLINKDGINKITGKKDDRIILVEEWLKTTHSMGGFAAKNGMSEKEFFRLVEEVRKIYPKLIENIEEKNDRTRDVYLFKNKEIAQKLLNGELKIENFAKDRQLKCDFDLMIKLLQSKEEKIQLTSLILDYITTGNIEITDYFNMFAKGKYKKESFKDVEKQLEVIEGVCKSIPELRKSIAGIKKQKRILESYKKPFFRNEINRMGYVDPKTNKVNMVEITDEIVEDAKRYINITENFLCSKTMQATILKIVKGEITKEQIDELYKCSGYQEKKNITSKKIGELGFEVGIGDIDKFDEAERVLETIVEKEKEGEKNKNE